ncbi:uncharacterized protein LOC141700935 [Apium graveolens]|uniref:uncharacterized protein LOC141700935 n=1 Tax=Apium graveolens TaxID=4045 RepID=UPI003D79A03C
MVKLSCGIVDEDEEGDGELDDQKEKLILGIVLDTSAKFYWWKRSALSAGVFAKQPVAQAVRQQQLMVAVKQRHLSSAEMHQHSSLAVKIQYFLEAPPNSPRSQTLGAFPSFFLPAHWGYSGL